MSRGHYILKGHEVVPCEMLEWARWFETAKEKRVVAKTQIGEASISTVFLGLDHAFLDGPPEIFETMIFGGPHDQEMRRYSTWEQAERGHEDFIEMLKAEL